MTKRFVASWLAVKETLRQRLQEAPHLRLHAGTWLHCTDTALHPFLQSQAQLARAAAATMGTVLPYRDINVHSSSSHYAFSSPSSPTAPTLVVDRPSGDIRLHDGKLLGSKRVSSVAGILGIIKLRLGRYPSKLLHTGALMHVKTSILSSLPRPSLWVG